jgi:hypothetical protein
MKQNNRYGKQKANNEQIPFIFCTKDSFSFILNCSLKNGLTIPYGIAFIKIPSVKNGRKIFPMRNRRKNTLSG